MFVAASVRLARSALETFEKWLQEPCIVGPVAAEKWPGHPSHRVQRCGSKLTCTRCHGKAKVVEGRFEVPERMMQRCQLQGSQDLRSFFA